MRTLFLTLITCLFVLPAHAKYSGGTGEPNDPYQMATAADLIALGEDPNDYDKHFILTADIDLDPNLPGRKVFDKAVIASDVNDTEPWFQGTPFAGVFDGNGHTISHLTINGGSYLGLFGELGNWEVVASVKDLGVVDVNIAASGSYVAGLVGTNSGTVANCHSTGTVNGGNCLGGLVGSNYGTATRCYSTGTVSGYGNQVGGLVGWNGSDVTYSYSTGVVSGGSYVGGLVGDNSELGTVAQCYSTGAVSGYSYAGGLVGENYYGSVTLCYSTGVVSGTGNQVGGLVGSGGSGVQNSVWDIESSGLSGSAGGVGLATTEMMDPYMLGLNGFANDPNWVLDGSRDYPRLAWEGTPGSIIPEPTIDWLVGEGKPEAPYRIDMAGQLILLGKAPILWDRHFVLAADINLDPALPSRRVFGQAVVPDFMGVFDGDGHMISHLTITGGSRLGLFGKLRSGAEIKDLGVVDVNITGSGDCVGGLVGESLGAVTSCYSSGTVSGDSYVGGLVGGNGGHMVSCWYGTGVVSGIGQWSSSVGGLVGSNNSTVAHCYSNGAVSGRYATGGLVGSNYGGTVTCCYSTGAVSGREEVGGLVGYTEDGSIVASYSTGAVSGDSHIGGLVGVNGGEVADCYSRSTASGDSSVGGLVGVNAVSIRDRTSPYFYSYCGLVDRCYSTGTVSGNSDVGGLVGSNTDDWGSDGIVTQSFWDAQTSGQATSAGGTGKTTTEMYDPNTFRAEGWDFFGQVDGPHDVWAEAEGGGYPILYWQLPSGLGLPRFSGGTGEPNDPYIISTPQELNSVGHNPRLITCHFKLVHDLDMIGCAFYPIGDHDYPYAGVFDGNGHTVSHLTITGESHVGLFGLLESGAKVKDLGVVDVNIAGSGSYVGGLVGRNGSWDTQGGTVTNCYSSGTVSGGWYVGGLVGTNGGTVTQCYSTGTVSGTGYHVGGLVGDNGYGSVTQCHSTGTVNGSSFVGGLVGSNYGGTVTCCYSTGTVSGTGYHVGGLVGYNGYGSVTQCHSSGAVTGTGDVGGLVGYNYRGGAIHCYSIGAVKGTSHVGGLVGRADGGTATACFWDIQTSGQATSPGGTGKTTAEMQTASTFLEAGWDFVGETANGTEDLWWILEGKDYPRLWWER